MGAGPVGMLTALGLAERGVRVHIVDRYRRAALHSYALALHPGTLRLLDEYGIAETLVERGQRLDRIDVYSGEDPRATIELAPLGGSFPFVLVVPQALLESALEQRLADSGIPVFWNHPVLMFENETDALSVLLAEVPDDWAGDDDSIPSNVSTTRVQPSYLVGADGYGSLARRLLSSPLQESGEPMAYGLVEFETTIEKPDRMTLVFGEDSTDVLWPLGPGRGRWGVQLDRDASRIDSAGVWEVVARRAPWFDSSACRTEWSDSVAFRSRLVRSYGQGRVWLAGDAAHFSSPVGVQSMNVGMREGYDLARRLAAILRDGGSPSLLRYYHEDREREWKMLLGLHDRLRRLPEARNWAIELGQRLVSALPASGHDLNLLLEQVGLRLRWLRRKTRKSLD